MALSWVSAVRAGARSGETPTLTALYVDPGARDAGVANTIGQKRIAHEISVLHRNAPAWAGITVVGETIEGRDPALLMASYARDHDSELVVLGTRAPEHRDAELGSVSADVTARLSIPVLPIPPAVWRDHAKDVDYS